MKTQGQIEIMLEMLKLESAKRIPTIDITPPPIEEWELRLIIWECRNVKSKDILSNLNDLYVSCSLMSTEYIEGIENQINTKSQKTDTHYRAKDGFGSFNWRMIWDLYLPCKQPPRLKLQLFDKDFGADDSICECIFSLKNLYKVGFLKKDTVTLYEDNNDKIWLDNLKHPNFVENQGEILISIQMLPKHIAAEFPAGKGREAPNQNPILFPPTGRIGFSLNPYKMISQIVGPSIMRKFKMYAILCCLIGGFVMFAPVIAMSIFNKVIDSFNPF